MHILHGFLDALDIRSKRILYQDRTEKDMFRADVSSAGQDHDWQHRTSIDFESQPRSLMTFPVFVTAMTGPKSKDEKAIALDKSVLRTTLY